MNSRKPTSDTVAAGDHSPDSPLQQSRSKAARSILAAAMAIAGIVAVTLGWTVLLVRATIWLFQG